MYSRTKELLITAPAIEPVSVEEARAHCRVLDHEDDEDLRSLIKTARQHLEEVCWSAFITQTWQYWWNSFASQMFVPRPPLQSVTWLKYMPTIGGEYTAVDTDLYETSSENGLWYIGRQYQQTYPTIRGHRDDVTAQVVVGYGSSASDVPMPIRQAIKLMVAHLFFVRGDEAPQEMPPAVWNLIQNYRFKEL